MQHLAAPSSTLDLFEQNRDALEALCRRVGVRRLDAFGSAVRSDFDPQCSVLDFIVEFEALSPAQFSEAFFELKDELERLLGRPVDLLTERSLENPYLRKRVEAERRPVYAR